MKIKFLGTGAAEGWPAMFCNCDVCKKARELGGKNIRNRSSIMINSNILVDFNADIHIVANNFGIDLTAIENIFITHCHQDHFYPQDIMMRLEDFGHCKTAPNLHIYGNDTCKEIGDSHLKNFSCCSDFNTIDFNMLLPYEWFDTGVIKVMPLMATHNPGEHCYIYQFYLDGKKILYGCDSTVYSKETFRKLKCAEFDIVILECTALKVSCDIGHCGIEQMLEIKQRLTESDAITEKTQVIITHFSHNGLVMHDELVDIMKPHNVTVAYDGYEVSTD